MLKPSKQENPAQLLMHKLPLKYGLALCLMALSYFSHSETLVIGGYHYPPFMNTQSGRGIYFALTQAINNESGLTFDWQFYPYARVDRLFTAGKIDLEVGSSPIWAKQKPLPGLSSDTFYSLEDIAVYHADKPQRARNTQDLLGKNIGIVRGYSHPPQFIQAFEQNLVKRIDGNNELQLLNLLAKGRLDQVFISKLVFLYLQKQNPEFKKMMFKDVVGRYPIAIRIHPGKAHIVPKLNAAIAALKSKKRIQPLFHLQP